MSQKCRSRSTLVSQGTSPRSEKPESSNRSRRYEIDQYEDQLQLGGEKTRFEGQGPNYIRCMDRPYVCVDTSGPTHVTFAALHHDGSRYPKDPLPSGITVSPPSGEVDGSLDLPDRIHVLTVGVPKFNATPDWSKETR